MVTGGREIGRALNSMKSASWPQNVRRHGSSYLLLGSGDAALVSELVGNSRAILKSGIWSQRSHRLIPPY